MLGLPLWSRGSDSMLLLQGRKILHGVVKQINKQKSGYANWWQLVRHRILSNQISDTNIYKLCIKIRFNANIL